MTTNYSFTVNMAIEKETKNTFRFHEVDEAGAPVGAWAKLPTQYVPMQSFPRGMKPKRIRVTVEVID